MADLAAELDEVMAETEQDARRRVVLTPAAEIRPKRVRWLWEGRLALGTLALLAGREGLGKSTLGYWLAAGITRGDLPGEHAAQPRAVLVCATEDSWAHTIVPRLIAADADLARVYRVEVMADAVHVGLSLPRDLEEVERAAERVQAGLLLLDPLMSRLDASLDSHRDHEVRLALEPLTGLADRAGLAVVGLIHHNKSASADPLQLVMGSRAFSAVARSVHTVVPDPDDDTGTRRLFGTPKNNLGRTDLPTLGFTVVGHPVETDDGTAWPGRVEWGTDSAVSITEAMRRAASDSQAGGHSAVTEAADWLTDWLAGKGGSDESAAVKRASRAAGHSDSALQRARQRLRVVTDSRGFPRVTIWSLPEALPPVVSPVMPTPRGDDTTDMTDTTEGETPSHASRVSCVMPPRARDTTGVTPARPPTPHYPTCRTCSADLWAPASQARGTCERCHRQAAS